MKILRHKVITGECLNGVIRSWHSRQSTGSAGSVVNKHGLVYLKSPVWLGWSVSQHPQDVKDLSRSVNKDNLSSSTPVPPSPPSASQSVTEVAGRKLLPSPPPPPRHQTSLSCHHHWHEAQASLSHCCYLVVEYWWYQGSCTGQCHWCSPSFTLKLQSVNGFN